MAYDGKEEEEEAKLKVKVKVTRKLFTEKFCPRCLSPLKIYGNLAGWVTPDQYMCEKCGYIGYVALEKE